ncbi:GntR family transcriptional regulator [Actinomadura sp. SCN-SB]|uniref:GntR family transcriptional regulator n=1 Tax=Actinomadura sp. SCN-SB TaxID=3373092 RepID=UPI003751EC69
MLDLDGPTPLFQQIAAILRGRIADGTYAPGKRMPSARAIADEFGVTRGTAVAALDVLKAEGLIYGVRGRGTFPRDPD